jgi:GDP/UDP-N,N'-diacetylbacillosamine 2-epimerase (hydrolysing)
MTATTRRRVTYLSGTRADFGLMKAALLHASQKVDVDVLVTGMHLDARYGGTLADIQASGLPILAQVPIDVQTRSAQSMSLALAQCLNGLTNALAANRPDILLLLGDRGEMLAGAIAALHLGIVTVHVHGGERSGTVDEPVRHAISKLCTYHCVATEQSRERLLRMGEKESSVFVTGAPGLDSLVADAQLTAAQCRHELGLSVLTDFLLVLFHPVVQQSNSAYEQTVQLLSALRHLSIPVVWLEPNADAGSVEILRALDELALPAGSVRVKHLPRQVFCSAMRHCRALVGNSSAGIIEASSFGTPVVNVGDRQRLRERNANVIDVPVQANAIEQALKAALEHGPYPCDNVYGDGHAGERIAQLLLQLPLSPALLEKSNSY